jgi:hypothetical protein
MRQSKKVQIDLVFWLFSINGHAQEFDNIYKKTLGLNTLKEQSLHLSAIEKSAKSSSRYGGSWKKVDALLTAVW